MQLEQEMVLLFAAMKGVCTDPRTSACMYE